MAVEVLPTKIFSAFCYLQVSEFETINGHYSMPEAIHKPVEPVVGDKSNGTSASGQCSN